MSDIDTECALAKLKSAVSEFEATFKERTSNADNFLTLRELEQIWGKLLGDSNIIYSNLLQSLLSKVDEKDLVLKKKGSTLTKGSNSRQTAEPKKPS